MLGMLPLRLLWYQGPLHWSLPPPPPKTQIEQANKKWKKDKKGGKGSTKEGEIQEETLLEQSKATKVTRAQKRRGGETSEMIPKRRTCIPSWIPPLVLDGAPLHADSSIHNFDNGRVGYVANSVEQTLQLPRDMAKLCNLKKHEMFLSLKRDLALVRFCIIFLLWFYYYYFFKILISFMLANFQATQAAHVAKEWVDQVLYKKKEEESRRYTA